LGCGRVSEERSEELRDAVDTLPRIWTEKHLEAYLRARWESEITEAGRAYNLLVQDRDGRVPRLSQLQSGCGRDQSLVRRKRLWTIQPFAESPPPSPQVQLMPADVIGFAKRLYDRCRAAIHTSRGTYPSSYACGIHGEIATLGIKLQMEEGLGRPPEMKELGRSFLTKQGPSETLTRPGNLRRSGKEAREFVCTLRDRRGEEKLRQITKGEA